MMKEVGFKYFWTTTYKSSLICICKFHNRAWGGLEPLQWLCDRTNFKAHLHNSLRFKMIVRISNLDKIKVRWPLTE